MTNGTIAAAIGDARALLDTLLAGDWQDAYVVSGDTQIFIARDGGQANPMRAARIAAPSTSTVGSETLEITAPHVATLITTAALGSQVEAGQTIATIRVLDAEEPVAAPCSGQITALSAISGNLLEYGMPILTLSKAA